MLGAAAGQVIGRLATVGLATAGMRKLRHTARRLAWGVAVAVVALLLCILALCWFGAAAWYLLLPQFGPAGAAGVTGLGFLVLAGVIVLACRPLYAKRHHAESESMSARASSLAAGAAAGSAIPTIGDLGAALERHAGTAMLVAFAVGLIAGRRK
jgi:hypothetical protein